MDYRAERIAPRVEQLDSRLGRPARPTGIADPAWANDNQIKHANTALNNFLLDYLRVRSIIVKMTNEYLYSIR